MKNCNPNLMGPWTFLLMQPNLISRNYFTTAKNSNCPEVCQPEYIYWYSSYQDGHRREISGG